MSDGNWLVASDSVFTRTLGLLAPWGSLRRALFDWHLIIFQADAMRA